MSETTPVPPSRPLRAPRVLLGAAALAALLALSACGKSESAPAPKAAPVHVAKAASREISDWDDFTGRFEAVESVQLRPRVSGYIDAVRFAEGSEVKKGEVLFQIDARPYQVALDRARAELARAQAQSDLAEREVVRAEQLLGAHAISREEFDQRHSDRAQALANLHAAQATLASAELDMEYTRVTSPIDGRVSRAAVTRGNYVNAGSTVLTSVVSLDPIYVTFEGDEQVYLKYTELAQRGERPSSRTTPNPVFVGLANEDDYPHPGRMNFVDNALDPQTGTIRARAVLDNPDHLFAPGMFARIRLLGSGRYNATLIPDEAVATDQDRRYVMVVNAQNVTEYRSVQLGKTLGDLRVVRKGLQPGERVVVSGLQRVRPGMNVAPEEVPAMSAAQTASIDDPMHY